MTSKRKRKYAQDFSGKSLTDTSFAPSCDVNNIIKHYESSGIDPYAERKAQARYGVASTLSYEDAMRNKAALDSYIAENPTWREKLSDPSYETISEESLSPAKQDSTESGASGAAEPAPQDTSGGEK